MASMRGGSWDLGVNNIASLFSSLKGSPLISVCKGLEASLNDKKKKYIDKVTALLSVWENVSVFIASSTHQQTNHLFDFIHKHTLNLVLRGDWPKLQPAVKTHLSVILQRCESLLTKRNSIAAPRCHTLIGLVNDPWGNASLSKILHKKELSDHEVLEFCHSEMGIVLMMRLEMLCESKCEDYALRLAEACLRCLRLPGSRLQQESAQDQMDYIMDIYLALLFRFKRSQDIIAELKQMELSEGLRLIQRYSQSSNSNARIWKNRSKVAEIAAHTVLASAMVHPLPDSRLLHDLIFEWANIHGSKLTNSPQTLHNMIRKMIQTAESSQHIYVFSKVLMQKFGQPLKSLCIELYIRALTTNMNEVEQQKMKNDKDKVREAEISLSSGFLLLADLVKDNLGVCRECVLTAFSLNPTESCYDRIKAIAVACGKCAIPVNKDQSDTSPSDKNLNAWNSANLKSCGTESENSKTTVDVIDTDMKAVDTGQEEQSNQFYNSEKQRPESNICPLHPYYYSNVDGASNEFCTRCREITGIEMTVPTSDKKIERTLDALILITGNAVTESLNYDVLSAPSQVLDADELGLTPHLCDDLATVLSSPRYQMLSWVLDWSELSSICEKYLENGGKIRNTTKELKFLNIDYNQFKDWPSDEEKDMYYGIEKGYEQCVELSQSDDEFYETTHKRQSKHSQDENSCDSLQYRKRKKYKKNNTDSSDSDYEFRGRKRTKHVRRRPTFNSDSDTATLDSRTDSLSNDSFNEDNLFKKSTSKRNLKLSQMPPTVTKIKSISIGVKEMHKDVITNEAANKEILSVYNQFNKRISSEDYKFTQKESTLDLLQHSKSSDPSVLKSLRMYRLHSPKKIIEPASNMLADSQQVIEAPPEQDQDKKVLDKFAPMLSTINLNPRIVLTKLASESNELDEEFTRVKTNHEFLTEQNYKLNLQSKLIGANCINIDVNGKSDILSHSVMRKDFLTKAVPGLNSLDMLGPVPSEATVQVVQLPGNVHPTSSPNSSFIASSTNSISLQNSSSPAIQPSISRSNENNSSLQTTHQPKSSTSTGNLVSTRLINSESQIQNFPETTSTSSSHLSGVLSTSNNTFLNLLDSENSFISSTSTSNTSSTNLPVSSTQISSSMMSQHILSSVGSSQCPVLSPLSKTTPIKHITFTNSTTSYQTNQPNQSTSQLPVSPAGSTFRQINKTVPVSSSVSTSSNVIRATSSQVHHFGGHVIDVPPTMQGASTPLTAHIQRIGQPARTVSSSGFASFTNPAQRTTNETNARSPEEQIKLLEQGAPVMYIFKDSQSETSSNLTMKVHTFSPDQIAQLLLKAVPTKENTSSAEDSSRSIANVASLPKFQQAFGKTMYQSNASKGSNNSTNNPSGSTSSGESQSFSQQSQTSSENKIALQSSQGCTVLSKAVQTTNKERDRNNKTDNTEQVDTKSKNSTITSSNIQTTASTTTTTTSTSLNISQFESRGSRIHANFSKTTDGPSEIIQTPPGVIFACKVPVTISNSNLLQGKPVAILKTSVTSEKIIQTQSKQDSESRGSETVIHSNMNALLAAALQNPCQIRSSNTVNSIPTANRDASVKITNETERKKTEGQAAIPAANVQRVALPQSLHKNFQRSNIVQQSIARYGRPVIQVTSGSSQNSINSPMVTIPFRTVHAVIAANLNQTTTSTTTSVNDTRADTLISHTAIDPSVSSTTLEQLREFESVLEQVTNTSQMKERGSVQTQSHLEPLNQQLLLPHQSISLPVKFTNTNTNPSTTALLQSVATSTVHDITGERVSLTFISQSSSGVTNSLISGSNQKLTSNTPVVVVQSCSRPVASPALSVTSQSSSSPAPPSSSSTSAGKITTSSKSNKSSKSKSSNKTTPTTTTLKVTTVPKPQQKPQEDEQTTQRIYAILDKYAEQLRNSPELKNKPAPRRRSNPPTNPSQTSKRKKSTQTKSKLSSQQASCSSSGMEMSPGSEDIRTMGSEDSSNGVSQISQVINSPQSRLDEPSTPTGGDVSSETSESLDSKDTRLQHRVVLTESNQSQSRTLIVQDSLQPTVINVEGTKVIAGKQVVVGGGTPVPLTLTLPNVPGGVKQVIFPVPSDGRPFVVTKVPKMYRVHQVTMPSGSPLLATTNSGAVVLRQMCLNKSGSGVKQLKLPVSGISSQNITTMSGQPTVVLPSGGHSFTFSQDSSLEPGESLGINIDNTILLNSTSASSISFLHRNVHSSYQSHVGTSNTNSLLSTAAVSIPTSSDVGIACFKPSNILSLCSSSTVPISSPVQEPRNRPAEKPRSNLDTSNLSCISLDYKSHDVEGMNYSRDIHGNSVSELPSMMISHSDGEKSWTQVISTDVKDQSFQSDVEKDDFDGKKTDISSLHAPVKSIIGLRIATTPNSLLIPKQEPYVANKDCLLDKKSLGLQLSNNLQTVAIKKELKSEMSLVKQSDLCDEDGSASSDSAGSGRVKQRPSGSISSEDKAHLLPDTSQDTGSPWPYTITKLDSLGKSNSPSTPLHIVDSRGTDGDNSSKTNHSQILSESQSGCYKRKSNNVENTIFQMAFRRSDRLRASSKEMDSIEQRNAAELESELRLQKSLSEECEDLGVDEPSTSDLFPEAELLLDPDPSSGADSHLEMPGESFPQGLESSSSSPRSVSPILRSSYIRIRNKKRNFLRVTTTSESLSEKCLSPSNNPLRKNNLPEHQKSSSSGTSTPVNGGSTASPIIDEMPASCTSDDSKETPSRQKSSEDNCKDTELELTSDSDCISPTVPNISSVCNDPLPSLIQQSKSFIPIPNQAAITSFTYSTNKNNTTFKKSLKRSLAHDLSWNRMLKRSCPNKSEDVDSDLSELGGNEKVTPPSSDDEIMSDGELHPRNGLVTELEDTQTGGTRSLRTPKLNRTSPVAQKNVDSRNKASDPYQIDCAYDNPSSSSLISPCVERTLHHSPHQHLSLNRRSSLRGHVKKGCQCCNGSPERPKKKKDVHIGTTKTEKITAVHSSLPLPSSSSKKSQTSSRSILKSHIIKKR